MVFETKTHSGALHLLELHFVKTGIISKELSKFYARLFGMRQNADYEDEVEYEKEDVINLLQPVMNLIQSIEVILMYTK